MTDTKRPDLSKLKIESYKKDFSSEGTKSNSKFGLKISVVAILVILIAISYFYLKPKQISKDSTDSQLGSDSLYKKQQPPNTSTSTSPATQKTTPTTLNATGYVVAQRQASVASKATGRLKELNVIEGDKVVADQILGALENEDLNALVAQQVAAVSASKSKVQVFQASIKEAELAYNRKKRLFERNSISRSDLERAEATYQRAKAELAASKSEVELSQALENKAKVDLEYTLIRAPFAGTVISKDADVGEVVAPFGSASNSRSAIVTIADMQSLQVEADVSEANINRVKLGQKCTITLDAYPDKKYQGEVTKIIPKVDRAKATVLVKIKFLQIDEQVIPEMSAKISFEDFSAKKQ